MYDCRINSYVLSLFVVEFCPFVSNRSKLFTRSMYSNVSESIVDVLSHKSTTKRSLVTFDYLQSFIHAFLNVKACFLLL